MKERNVLGQQTSSHTPPLLYRSDHSNVAGAYTAESALSTYAVRKHVSQEILAVRLQGQTHQGQHVATTYGLIDAAATVLQTHYAAPAYRSRNPTAPTGPLNAVLPSIVEEPTTGGKDRNIQRWQALEIVKRYLDGKRTRLVPENLTVQELWQRIRSVDLCLRLPFDVADEGTGDVGPQITVGGQTFHTSDPVPWSGATPIGADALLETAAVAGCILTWEHGKRLVHDASSVYSTAQRLFLSALPREQLRTFLDKATVERIDVLRSADNERPPLSELYDWLDETGRMSPLTLSHLQGLVFLFCSIVELSLCPSMRYQGSTDQGRPLTWFDLHPGWRFLRALDVITKELLRNGSEGKLKRWITRTRQVEGVICSALAWPDRYTLYEEVGQWKAQLEVGDSDLLQIDLDWLLERSAGVREGLLVVNSSLGALVYSLAEGSALTDELLREMKHRENLMAAWGKQQHDRADTMEGWTVEWNSGRLVKPLHLKYLTGLSLERLDSRSPADAQRILDSTPSSSQPLSALMDAGMLPLDFLVMRAIVAGTEGFPMGQWLADRLCSPDASARRHIEDAAANAFLRVSEERVYL